MLKPLHTPRARVYLAYGVGLALGAPLGHLLLRALLDGSVTPAWVVRELSRAPVTYAYLLFSTSLVFAILGYLLGRKDDDLRRTAITDTLTGLANRRLFDVRLRDELHRVARYGEPLSLLAVDVDGLKKINDHLGHEAGDAAIRAVAETLTQTIRSSDVAARVGGDEFAIIAPATTGEDGVELAGRIRAALARRAPGPWPLPTVSVGVADTTRVPALRAEDLCGAADRALYAAKAGGRDRAVLLDVIAPASSDRKV